MLLDTHGVHFSSKFRARFYLCFTLLVNTQFIWQSNILCLKIKSEFFEKNFSMLASRYTPSCCLETKTNRYCVILGTTVSGRQQTLFLWRGWQIFAICWQQKLEKYRLAFTPVFNQLLIFSHLISVSFLFALGTGKYELKCNWTLGTTLSRLAMHPSLPRTASVYSWTVHVPALNSQIVLVWW